MEGGICEWQVAGSVNVHQAPNVLELIAEYTRISKIDGAGALVWMAHDGSQQSWINKLFESHPYHVQAMISQGLSTALMS